MQRLDGMPPFEIEGWDSLGHMAPIDALRYALQIRWPAMQFEQAISLADACVLIDPTMGDRQKG